MVGLGAAGCVAASESWPGGGVEAVDGSEFPSALALQALPEPYMVVDAETRLIIRVNDAMTRFVGYSEAQLLTMRPADLLAPGDSARVVQAYEHLTPGVITRREWIGRRSDGSQLLVNVTSVPLVLNARLVVQMLIHDLSEQSVEADLRAMLSVAHDRLAIPLEYEETLQTIVELLVPGVADRCVIALSDEGGALMVAADSEGEDGEEAALSSDLQATAGPSSLAEVEQRELAAEAATFDLRAHNRDLGRLTLFRRQSRAWGVDDRSLATALARRAAQAIHAALLWQTTQRELARRAALHRISRAFAESPTGSDRVMQVLLDECMAMVGADHGGIALWDAPSGALIQVYSSTGRSNGMKVGLEGSLSGAAAKSSRTVISNEYQREYARVTPAGRFGAQAGIATPLLHEGRLIGVLSVGTREAGRRFGPDAAEAVEVLGGMAASMLGTLERAQLHAVSLAARELAHRLNNDLALAVGAIDLLRHEPNVSSELRGLISEAADGLQRIEEQLAQLQQLVRFQTRQTPVGPALDLDGSTGPSAGPFSG